jgi:stage V sporulation protein G
MPTKAQNQTQTPEQALPPLQYDVRIQSLLTHDSTRARASVNINGQFAITGVKVVEGSKGLFISMPSYKNGKGDYKDIAFPCTKESKAAFDAAVLDAYGQALTQTQASAPAQKEALDPFESQALTGQTM